MIDYRRTEHNLNYMASEYCLLNRLPLDEVLPKLLFICFTESAVVRGSNI
jgi:hypothetical protein